MCCCIFCWQSGPFQKCNWFNNNRLVWCLNKTSVKCPLLHLVCFKSSTFTLHVVLLPLSIVIRCHRGHDRMVLGFSTNYAITAYHHYCCELEFNSWRYILDTQLHVCAKVCEWLTAGRWFSPGTLVSSTYENDHYNIVRTVLKVALNTMTLTLCCPELLFLLVLPLWSWCRSGDLFPIT